MGRGLGCGGSGNDCYLRDADGGRVRLRNRLDGDGCRRWNAGWSSVIARGIDGAKGRVAALRSLDIPSHGGVCRSGDGCGKWLHGSGIDLRDGRVRTHSYGDGYAGIGNRCLRRPCRGVVDLGNRGNCNRGRRRNCSRRLEYSGGLDCANG